MIDEARQDLATSYILGELDERAAAAFRAALGTDEELRQFVSELHEAAAELALAAPPLAPPPETLGRLLERIQGGSPKAKVVRFSWVPWALAASLAIVCSWLALQRGQLRRDIFAFQEKDTLSRLQIATLGAQAEAYAKALAVVIWDAEKQSGVVKLEQLPRPAVNKDYQLWVIDPSYATPVSAGVLEIADDGFTSAVFRPQQPIHSASKFAVSVERKGGAATPEGQIIMLSP